MDWNDLYESVEDLFDEHLANLDPDEGFTRILLISIKGEMLKLIKSKLEILEREHNEQVYLLDDDERSIDA